MPGNSKTGLERLCPQCKKLCHVQKDHWAPHSFLILRKVLEVFGFCTSFFAAEMKVEGPLSQLLLSFKEDPWAYTVSFLIIEAPRGNHPLVCSVWHLVLIYYISDLIKTPVMVKISHFLTRKTLAHSLVFCRAWGAKHWLCTLGGDLSWHIASTCRAQTAEGSDRCGPASCPAAHREQTRHHWGSGHSSSWFGDSGTPTGSLWGAYLGMGTWLHVWDRVRWENKYALHRGTGHVGPTAQHLSPGVNGGSAAGPRTRANSG